MAVRDAPVSAQAESASRERAAIRGTTARNINGAASIWQRELVRFLRERSRSVTSLVQPLLYLLVFGTGLGRVVNEDQFGPGIDFQDFLLPGVIVMTVLFTSMFSGMSIVWDREFGFLKEILVAPVSRPAVILGKVTGGATTACIQGLAILIFAPIIGLSFGITGALKVIPALIVFALAVNLLGVAIASRTQTMQAFMVIQNFVMLPLFFLSGAIFPLADVPVWLRIGAVFDPATYAVHSIRSSLIGEIRPTRLWGDFSLNYGVDLAVLAVFGAVLFVFAVRGINKQP